VELDSQNIERRDFPIGRRGYDPAAVDAHLRALATAVEELRRAAAAPGGGWASDSLAASAGSQVQAIVAAAEVAAAEIESDAQANAEQTRARAQADAEKTRADAIAQAQAHVAAIGRATAVLLARVESLDGETGALVDSIRAGGTRLAGDLAAVETNMGELYDAAAGRASAENGTPPGPGVGESQAVVSAVAKEAPEPHVPPLSDDVPAPPVATNDGAEGARLVALNMALNGDSREETDRYLAENYEIENREKLLDEVYAAIEG
jgi:DivIVA domain-containing protein